MAHIVNDIIQRFRRENIVGKYIYITVAIYLAIALSSVVATLFNSISLVDEIVACFELPANLKQLLYRPWSLVTYMFLHANFMHILWNMLALYVFGKIFLEFYSTRHFIGVYFLGGITGGLFFVIAYNIFPYFENILNSSYLVGASASILAVVTATAVRSPNYTVNLFLIGAVRLSKLAIVTVLLSFLFLFSSGNAGGNFAHIGGAVAGWLFAYMLGKGRDVTSLITLVNDFVVNAWHKISSRPNKPKMKVKHNMGKHHVDYEYNSRCKENEDEMNRILEKIKKGGYSSLTDEEKKFLFDVSKR